MKQKISYYIFLIEKDDRTMTSGWQGARYFRRYGRELMSEPAISLKKGWGRATVERTPYWTQHVHVYVSTGAGIKTTPVYKVKTNEIEEMLNVAYTHTSRCLAQLRCVSAFISYSLVTRYALGVEGVASDSVRRSSISQ